MNGTIILIATKRTDLIVFIIIIKTMMNCGIRVTMIKQQRFRKVTELLFIVLFSVLIVYDLHSILQNYISHALYADP